MKDSPKLKRRWYQFSLLTLLLATVVLCVGFAWIGARMRRAEENRERGDMEQARVERTVPRLEEVGGTGLSGQARR